MATALTEYEMKLVTDQHLLLTKNKIIQKVCEFFGGLSELYKNVIIIESSPSLNLITPKISRGENYKGLPYVILDYPRQFGKVDVFAIRTFFWWGNFFSITLQLSGQYKNDYLPHIEKAIDEKLFESWYVGSSDDPWQHHFESDNYQPLQPEKKYDFEDYRYLKIAKKIPLDKWDEAETFFEENFKLLIKILAS
ncbi:hypothetical protein [Segetibacter aerophilus]|uniref:Uncharacterized protein n=1 Tax=Segetibacter aerophilus TaxID=670293 RepID=A0A512BGP7_9BACT|nr:hypothetical protein [Segetibacter aerophilus]GEO11045.1 hypothetical protein SAE01_35410 [Segetibacter aerophilus]